MKLFKTKSGFTLIELLVVIGILAVLAAIAIPSVAGLIDRANVSADKTNANEMTNAIERFTSEYELYCQDIASGVIDANTTDFDAAQGRVYNVTQVKTRAQIETLEVAEGATVEETAIAIYRDTKYPVNAKTLKAIVENYTKTSSATFDPKQSDMHFWYSPDCGVVVFAEPDADVVTDLNSQIHSGMDAKGNELSGSTQWIDITLDSFAGNPPVLDMNTVSSVLDENDWATIQAVIKAGKAKDIWQVGDTATVIYDGQPRTVRLIDFDNDGENTATFMMVGTVGKHIMNPKNPEDKVGFEGDNIGGYVETELYRWMETDVYPKFADDVKSVMKTVTKKCALGSENPDVAVSFTCKVFIPAVIELAGENGSMKNGALNEGKQYKWFADGNMFSGEGYSGCWTRTAHQLTDSTFCAIADLFGNLASASCSSALEREVVPYFVVG